MLGADDVLVPEPRRVLVAGTTGVGKTTTAGRIGRALGIRHTEIDSIYHGPDWTPRESFLEEVEAYTSEPTWVTEWQYTLARDMLAARADTLVWIDLPVRSPCGGSCDGPSDDDSGAHPCGTGTSSRRCGRSSPTRPHRPVGDPRAPRESEAGARTRPHRPAPADRAPPDAARGRPVRAAPRGAPRLESTPSASVAQWIEQVVSTHRAAGSIPAGGTDDERPPSVGMAASRCGPMVGQSSSSAARRRSSLALIGCV